MTRREARQRPGGGTRAASVASAPVNRRNARRARGRVTTQAPPPQEVAPHDFAVVERLPRDVRRPTDLEIDALAWLFGPHVPELVRTGRLDLRLGPFARYFRPAGWRSMTVDEQLRMVSSMLNGDPARAVA